MIDLATVRLLGVSDPTRAGGVPVAGEVLTRDTDRVAGEVAYTMRSLLVAFSAGLRPARPATSRSRPCRSRLDLMQGRQLMHRARPVPRPVCDDVRLSGRHHRAPPLHHRVLDPPATPDTAGGGASGRCRSPFRPPRWAGCRDRLELRRVPGRALGRDFRTRGARQGEQIQLLRRFFTQSVGDFPGRYHRADRAHSHPNRHPNLIWAGGIRRSSVRPGRPTRADDSDCRRRARRSTVARVAVVGCSPAVEELATIHVRAGARICLQECSPDVHHDPDLPSRVQTVVATHC